MGLDSLWGCPELNRRQERTSRLQEQRTQRQVHTNRQQEYKLQSEIMSRRFAKNLKNTELQKNRRRVQASRLLKHATRLLILLNMFEL